MSETPSATAGGATQTPPETVISPLIDETSRLSHGFQRANDQASRQVGLSSARCLTLEQVELAPMPVAQIARRLGLTRQTVQRTADSLLDGGLIEYRRNPEHRRAKLVSLTENGRLALRLARRAQQKWQLKLSTTIASASVDAAVNVLRQMRLRLDQLESDLELNEPNNVETSS
jgi:DNA-binding MarR family transcriptional regulator